MDYYESIKKFSLIMEEEDPCWDNYKMIGMKDKDGKKVPNCVKKEEEFDDSEMESEDVDGEYTSYEPMSEAEYQGRKVKLNKPMRGDVKKFKVYVSDGKNKDGTTKVKKVNFGDPDMKIKKSNPERRKSFRARHKCDQKKDKTTAGYWSCRKW
jgi:hypothetical protein